MEFLDSLQTKLSNTLKDDFDKHPYLTAGAVLAGTAALALIAKPFSKSIIAGVKDEFALEGDLGSALMSPAASSQKAMLKQAQRAYDRATALRMKQAVVRDTNFNYRKQEEIPLPEGIQAEEGKTAVPLASFWRKSPEHVNTTPDTWLAQTNEIAKKTVFRVERRDGTHMGSGFFSSPEGHFFSARHVFEHSGDGQIRMADGTVYPFKVLARDSNADVGLAKVSAAEGTTFDFLKLGKPTRVESVRAAGIGYPGTEPFSQPIISPGRIRGVGYGESASAHFTMHVEPGNSGGPIIGKEHEVLSLVQSGDSPTHLTKSHWIPPRAYGPSAEHMQALLDVHTAKGLENTDYLHVSSNTLPEGANRNLIITDKEFDDLRANPKRIDRIEKRYQVKIKSASYWSDN